MCPDGWSSLTTATQMTRWLASSDLLTRTHIRHYVRSYQVNENEFMAEVDGRGGVTSTLKEAGPRGSAWLGQMLRIVGCRWGCEGPGRIVGRRRYLVLVDLNDLLWIGSESGTSAAHNAGNERGGGAPPASELNRCGRQFTAEPVARRSHCIARIELCLGGYVHNVLTLSRPQFIDPEELVPGQTRR